MTADTTFDTVARCVARLDQVFGNADADQRRRLAEMRLLAVARPWDAQAAVDRACLRWVRRPTTEELASLLLAERLGRVDEDDVTPPSDLAARLAELRTLLDRDLEVRAETEAAVMLALRDSNGVHDLHRSATSDWSCSSCPGGVACVHTSLVRDLVNERVA